MNIMHDFAKHCEIVWFDFRDIYTSDIANEITRWPYLAIHAAGFAGANPHYVRRKIAEIWGRGSG